MVQASLLYLGERSNRNASQEVPKSMKPYTKQGAGSMNPYTKQGAVRLLTWTGFPEAKADLTFRKGWIMVTALKESLHRHQGK